MTQKELLYLEDALKHETILIDTLINTVSELDDDNLKVFMRKQLKKHQNLKDKLIEELEVAVNE